MFTDHGPIVAVNANAANPHYEPTQQSHSAIKRDDLLLIDMWAKLDRSGMQMMHGQAPPTPISTTPMVHIYGAKSRIVEHRKAGAPSPFPAGLIEIEIPDAHHHIMIDQPLALVASLRTLLAAWPR